MSASATDGAVMPVRLGTDYFERLFEGAGLAIFACDTRGRIEAWNALGEALIHDRGVTPNGAQVREILLDRDRSIFDEHLKALIDGGEPVEFRVSLPRSDGGNSEYALWLARIPNPDGSLRGASVWFHDITTRIQLRRNTRRSERLNSLGAMSGSVAHHYSNILCGIATSLEFALNMNTMAAMRRSLQRTADAVGRATNLTQQLLAFAQADFRQCDLADLTEMVLYHVDENEAALRASGIELTLDWEVLPTISLPREQFNIILSNIVSNAVEALNGRGSVHIGLARLDESRVRLAVSDTGSGIAPQHMERLFEPFFTTKGELDGGQRRAAGMGLAVVYGLVSEMRGTISAHNRAGGGACFEIILPVA